MSTTPHIVQLRKEAKTKGITFYKQGNQWIRSVYVESLRSSVTEPQHYNNDNATEKQMLLRELGYAE
jgi:hypothetical protein